MKLVLRAKVDRLGRAGEIVEVADGYARNYLLPRRLAMPATRENQKRIEAEKRRAAAREAVRMEKLSELAKELEGKSVTISVKATEDNKLYGSVSAKEIAAAVRAEHNFEIDPAHVVLEAPFKELGVYDIPVKIHPEVDATVKVWVVEE